MKSQVRLMTWLGGPSQFKAFLFRTPTIVRAVTGMTSVFIAHFQIGFIFPSLLAGSLLFRPWANYRLGTELEHDKVQRLYGVLRT